MVWLSDFKFVTANPFFNRLFSFLLTFQLGDFFLKLFSIGMKLVKICVFFCGKFTVFFLSGFKNLASPFNKLGGRFSFSFNIDPRHLSSRLIH